jgi:hypothetical protein
MAPPYANPRWHASGPGQGQLVYTRLMDRLVELKDAWAKSADRAEELRDAYHAAIVEELESGRRSQADVARITGYSREWLRVLAARQKEQQ